ncbi:MAG TPA: YraN family protein [bacterium]|nr:YraN family protein [bacterium]
MTSSPRESHSEGRRGEARAAAYFRRRGWKVEAKNFRAGPGEIDLIVSKEGQLVFVEVKMRRGSATGDPLEAVSPRKVQRVSAAAAAYLSQRGGDTPHCRFDILTLGPDKTLFGTLKMRHYENAYESDGRYMV